MSQAERRLLLHIGSPKCGSTYLQRVLIGNAKRLKARGIQYPKPNGRHPGNGREVGALDGGGLHALFGASHTLILSHEDLFGLAGHHRHLGALCAEAGIGLELLVFLRPFSEFLYGDYSQNMKQHIESYLAKGAAYDGLSFEEFAVRRRGQINPLGWLRAWSKIAEGRMRLASHREIRAVLSECLGAPDLDWAVERGATNPSLRVSDCEEIASAIQHKLPADRVREMFGQAHAKTGLPDPGRTPERQRWLEALFRTQYQGLETELGYRNPALEPA